MAQLDCIEAIEKRLWDGADTLRANSSCNEKRGSRFSIDLVTLFSCYVLDRDARRRSDETTI